MSKLILDPELRARLNGLNEEVQLLDEDGKVVGLFLPTDMYQKLVYSWANAQVTNEELECISREPGGRALAAIWKDLGRQ
jgi:hypothetical protein